MATKGRPPQASFNGGEISPETQGRIDLDRWLSSLAQCANFIPLVEGGFTRRPGTRYVAPTKEINARLITEVGDYRITEEGDNRIVEDDSTISTRPTLLFPFVFSDTQAYVIEIGDFYARFFMNDGQLYDESALEYRVTESGERRITEASDYRITEDLDPAAQPYEIATPWAATDIHKIQTAQTRDVMYAACKGYAPRQISRTGHTDWTISLFAFTNGPWRPVNDTAVTLTPSAVTQGASITLAASSDTFDDGHVGALFRLEDVDQANYDTWEPGEAVTDGDEVFYAGNVYEALNSGTTGAVAPVHLSGDRADGVGKVVWRYLHSGYGVVKITAVSDAQNATAVVLSRLPSTGGTTKWREGAWSDYRGWPVAVALFEQRLWWARDQTVWGSVAGDFTDYTPGDLADDAITADINSKTANAIEVLADGPTLALLTRAREWVLEAPNGEALSAEVNFRARSYSSEGAARVPPVLIDNAILFVGRSGRKLYQLFYDRETNGYRVRELSLLARHIAKPGQ